MTMRAVSPSRVIAIRVVLDVRVANASHQLRMRFQDMVRLQKCFLRSLPVARQVLRHVQLDVALVHAPIRKVLRQHSQVIRERRGELIERAFKSMSRIVLRESRRRNP